MRPLIGLMAMLSLNACAATLPQQQELPQESTEPHTLEKQKETLPDFDIRPLPGQLNTHPVWYSNRPELLTTPGAILSTQDLSSVPILTGRFSAFTHHVVETQPLDFSDFRLGLLASAPQNTVLHLEQVYFARTRPEALFIDTPQVTPQTGSLWSGPGDAMAFQRLQGIPQQALIPPSHFALNEDQEILLFELPIPTDPWHIAPRRNGLSLWLDAHSDQPIHLRWVAIKQNGPGTLADYQAAAKAPAGPAELPATQYDPAGKPPGGSFRFGRVAGLVQGSQWQGTYTLTPADWQKLKKGQALAWPISSTYLKRWGTEQNQSAPIAFKTPESAVESHGNYGVSYEVSYRLSNPEATSQTLKLRWSQPSTHQSQANPPFVYHPEAQVVFRGTIAVRTSSDKTTEYIHLQTRRGVWPEAFYQVELAPQETKTLTLSWVYPPDAIPPQLLSLERISNKVEVEKKP